METLSMPSFTRISVVGSRLLSLCPSCGELEEATVLRLVSRKKASKTKTYAVLSFHEGVLTFMPITDVVKGLLARDS
jgi:hypothetical protein